MDELHIKQPQKKRDWAKIDIKSYRGQKTIALFNKFRMQNELNTITYDQMTELAQTFRPDADMGLAVNKTKVFLKTPEVLEKADSDLRQALLKNNINPDFTITKRVEILNNAITSKQLNAANVALDRLEDHIGLNNKVKVSETRQINSNLESNYEKAKQTQTITTTINAGKTENQPKSEPIKSDIGEDNNKSDSKP